MLSCRAAKILKKKLVHLVVSVLELIKPVVKIVLLSKSVLSRKFRS
jgi:hypothetical protein